MLFRSGLVDMPLIFDWFATSSEVDALNSGSVLNGEMVFHEGELGSSSKHPPRSL